MDGMPCTFASNVTGCYTCKYLLNGAHLLVSHRTALGIMWNSHAIRDSTLPQITLVESRIKCTYKTLARYVLIRVFDVRCISTLSMASGRAVRSQETVFWIAALRCSRATRRADELRLNPLKKPMIISQAQEIFTHLYKHIFFHLSSQSSCQCGREISLIF